MTAPHQHAAQPCDHTWVLHYMAFLTKGLYYKATTQHNLIENITWLSATPAYMYI